MDYKKLGLKCGIEIHKQLDTDRKLFCSCASRLSEKSTMKFNRKLRPVAGEMGEVDAAAMHEKLKDKNFVYTVYNDETCLVETDSEPPHELNREALEICLKIAVMLHCEIPDEIHVMRKTVIDGSNTSGFQRTAIVGINGHLDTSFGKVGITNVAVEEDSCQILKKEKKEDNYGLDRLGIPLIEIGTAPDIHVPEQAKEVAKKLGNILKSTGKVKRGLGTIRQDLNVSITKGTRIELKGVQDLDMIPTYINKEIERQMKGKISKDVRRVMPSGTSEFMRPLAGSARLYPETDIPPIRITHSYLNKIGAELPEDIEKRIKRFMKQYKINAEISDQLIDLGYDTIFEAIVSEGFDSSIVSRALTSTLKDLRRSGVKIDDVPGFIIIELFKAFKKKKVKQIPKEAIEKSFKEIANNHHQDLSKLVEKLGVKSVSDSEVRKLVKSMIKKNKNVLSKNRPENILMGMIMKEARGKIPGSVIMKILKEELKS